MRLATVCAVAFSSCVAALPMIVSATSISVPAPRFTHERLCGSGVPDGKAAALRSEATKRTGDQLKLNKAQMAAFTDLMDLRAQNEANKKDALCAGAPDLSTFEKRLIFRQTMAQDRVDVLKAETTKILAFYKTLDDSQKSWFEELISHGSRGLATQRPFVPVPRSEE